jgi:hypothetical protein
MSTRIHRDATFPPEYLEAEHDGYARLGVIHRRRLLNIPGEYWIVADDFRGSGRHRFEFGYHFGAGLNLTIARPSETELEIREVEAGFTLAMVASAPLAARLLCGETHPAAGWVSSGYGNKRPCPALFASLSASAPASAITLLVPQVDASAEQQPPAIEQLHVSGGNAIACSIQRDGFRDIAVFSASGSPIEIEDFQMQGEFFWWRMRGAAVLKAVAIRGSLRRHGSNVLEEIACAQSAA